MGVSFTDYLSMLGTALVDQQGPHLAYLLRPTSKHAKDIIKEFRGNPTVSMFSDYILDRLYIANGSVKCYRSMKGRLPRLGTKLLPHML